MNDNEWVDIKEHLDRMLKADSDSWKQEFPAIKYSISLYGYLRENLIPKYEND